jgi:type VI secretion system protein ImpC
MTEPTPAPLTVPEVSRRAAALRLLVIADLAAGREAGPVPVEKGAGGVDAALAAFGPALSLTVPSHLGSGARELAVSLRFTGLDSFRPDAVAQQVPALAAAGGADSGGGSPLDALLSQIELPAGMDNVARQVAEIANAAPFRSLEAAWRGAALLARRAAAHPEIRLEVLAAPREDFLDVFFEKVFPAEHEGSSDIPLSAVVLGYEFDRSPADVEVLRNAARMGESLRVPFLAAVGEAFWGLRQAKLLAGLPDLVRKLQGPEYAKWNGLRAEEVSLWLSLAANRVLLRDAWSADDKPLWGSGAWALGAVLLQGFTAAGVSFPMTGKEPPALLADLGEPPVEVLLPDQKVLELLQVGLVPLAAAKGEPTAHLPGAPTLHAPKRYDRAEATLSSAAVATLPYQAFAGAAAHVLQELGREIGPGLGADEVKRRFEGGLLAFLASAEEAPAAEEVEVEVQPEAADPLLWEVIVRLKPRFQISGGEVDLVLGSAVLR